ncbi:cytochrome P450 [Periconia macrospinosa]|uniref:Cytochrome P450 n=1 Tax=Periconia macrospinosa TaxID=97972 RepID=A0A2V1E6W7_9PLEO|nr:cytochrome P450 [Periconia macrospinosa]
MLLATLPSIYAWTILAILVTGMYLFGAKRRRPVFPIVNKYPHDFLNQKANRQYIQNASTLITSGLNKHQSPVTIVIPNGQKIVLPSSLTGWVKTNKDLDHKKLVQHDFFAGFPGFDAQDALQHPNETLIGVIRTKLGQNDSTMEAMNASLAKAFRVLWGDGDGQWRIIDWHNDTMGIIAHAASSVFVGPEKADDGEWLEIVQGYVTAYFTAVGELHGYPSWSRSMVHWFLPNAAACRKYVSRARAIMNDVLQKRREEVKLAKLQGREGPEYNDALAWIQAASSGNEHAKTPEPEAGDFQLALAMAALFTTTEAFRQVLIHLAAKPDVVEALRSEVSKQIEQHGISVAATNNMVLLDSVMKESQRLSAAVVALERIAVKDTTLPDGTLIPRGSHITVDSTSLLDSSSYPNPLAFDAHRFLRKRQAGDKSNQFVQSGPDYSVFGGGRHICPGRFFAANEVKLALAHVLLKYDFRLAEGYESKNIRNGFYTIVDPMAKFEIKRRKPSLGEVLG